MKFTKVHLSFVLVSSLLIICGAAVIPQVIQIAAVDPNETFQLPADEVEYVYEPIVKNMTVDHGTDGTAEASGNGGKINVNAAGSDELQMLPRVGKKTAMDIIEHRKSNGPFNSLDELTAIKGLGKKTIDKFRNLAYCGPVDSQLSKAGTLEDSSMDTVKQNESSLSTQPPPEKKKASDDGSCRGKININTADIAELMKLPRIGKKTAERIVQYRKTNGSFANVDSLIGVKGIGKKTMEKLRPLICVEKTNE